MTVPSVWPARNFSHTHARSPPRPSAPLRCPSTAGPSQQRPLSPRLRPVASSPSPSLSPSPERQSRRGLNKRHLNPPSRLSSPSPLRFSSSPPSPLLPLPSPSRSRAAPPPSSSRHANKRAIAASSVAAPPRADARLDMGRKPTPQPLMLADSGSPPDRVAKAETTPRGASPVAARSPVSLRSSPFSTRFAPKRLQPATSALQPARQPADDTSPQSPRGDDSAATSCHPVSAAADASPESASQHTARHRGAAEPRKPSKSGFFHFNKSSKGSNQLLIPANQQHSPQDARDHLTSSGSDGATAPRRRGTSKSNRSLSPSNKARLRTARVAAPGRCRRGPLCHPPSPTGSMPDADALGQIRLTPRTLSTGLFPRAPNCRSRRPATTNRRRPRRPAKGANQTPLPASVAPSRPTKPKSSASAAPRPGPPRSTPRPASLTHSMSRRLFEPPPLPRTGHSGT